MEKKTGMFRTGNKLIASATLAMALVAGAAFMALPANASTIDWTLANVLFDDTGTASGTFSVDSTTGFVTAFNISTTAGTTLGAAVYDSTNGSVLDNFLAPNSVAFLFDDLPTRYLRLAFANALTSPGLNPLVIAAFSGSYECLNCSPARFALSGEAVSSVPLPAALPLFASSLAGLGWLSRRRRKQPQAA